MISNSSANTLSRPNTHRRLSRGSGPLGLLAALLLWGLPLCAAAQTDPPPADAAARENTWYGMTISQNVTGFVVTHYWSKGSSMRAEVVVAGRRIVTIVTPTLYYTLDLTRGTGLGIARSDLAKAADATRLRPFGDEYAAILRGGGEFVAEETLAKQSVNMYRLTNDAGRVQVWTTKNMHLPVRVERWDRKTGDRDHVDYVDWLRGFPIADAFFEPPEGLDLEVVDYPTYVSRAMTEPMGPAPPLYAHLLHGEPGAPAPVVTSPDSAEDD
ncbi:MAG: hypothetical protein VX246_10705 [Myxococcota bacterium]|nr:hypothetical protein [Myxococcota bacterium]